MISACYHNTRRAFDDARTLLLKTANMCIKVYKLRRNLLYYNDIAWIERCYLHKNRVNRDKNRYILIIQLRYLDFISSVDVIFSKFQLFLVSFSIKISLTVSSRMVNGFILIKYPLYVDTMYYLINLDRYITDSDGRYLYSFYVFFCIQKKILLYLEYTQIIHIDYLDNISIIGALTWCCGIVNDFAICNSKRRYFDDFRIADRVMVLVSFAV